MPVQPLEQEVRRLQNEVLALGGIIERAIVQSVEALRQRTLAGSQSLITLDHDITKRRFVIELEGISLVAAGQLLEDDLQTVTALLEVTTELEYISEYIADIAGTHLIIVKVEEPLLDLLFDINRMGAQAQSMLRRALEAFTQQDLALARAIHAEDEKVNALYRRVYRKTLTFMDNRSRVLIKQARYLSRIARNLERTADRVTNICEWVVFANTGDIMQPTDQSIDLYQEILT
jgi:phosphate transport system protein